MNFIYSLTIVKKVLDMTPTNLLEFRRNLTKRFLHIASIKETHSGPSQAKVCGQKKHVGIVQFERYSIKAIFYMLAMQSFFVYKPK